jgi:hypothetical protein
MGTQRRNKRISTIEFGEFLLTLDKVDRGHAWIVRVWRQSPEIGEYLCEDEFEFANEAAGQEKILAFMRSQHPTH